MKFLVDVQLPRGLCIGLADRGHDAVHVADVLGRRALDREIVRIAIAEDRIVLTKDSDFALLDTRTGFRIVWLRVGNVTNRALIRWLEPRWGEVEAMLEAGELLIEVV
jgi:predicted nuclease of predicted toxin-antitoxin system